MSVTHPQGFRAAGVAAGLKSSGHQGPRPGRQRRAASYASAAVFTANRCKANPVLWSQEVVKDGVVRAVVLNSGGANCYTGAEGFQTTHAVAERVADGLGIGAVDVVVCSTGLIGLTNDRAAPARRRRRRARRRSTPTAGGDAADGDHDHRHGAASRSSSRAAAGRSAGWPRAPACSRRSWPRCSSCSPPTPSSTPPTCRPRAARGHPGQLRPARLRRLHVDQRHRHADGQRRLAASPRREDDFTEALTRACTDLAMQLLADAEGADHEIAITVLNAATEDDAVEVGRSVARSNLFKAAVFGKDPNWGRVLACIGTTDAAFDPADLDVAMNGVWVCRSLDARPRTRPGSTSTGREVTVTIDLKAGDAPRHRLDQRPDPRLRPRELRLLS